MAETGSVTVTIDDEKIKERIRDLLAQAWDEGAGSHHVWSAVPGTNLTAWKPAGPNPYRDDA